MRPPIRVRLRGRQGVCVGRVLDHAACPRLRLHAQMVWLSHQGYSPPQISQITHRSEDTVRRWLHRFEKMGCAGLREFARSGRPPRVTASAEKVLRRWVQRSPRNYGIDRPTWTTATLAKCLGRKRGIRVSEDCIRKHLHRVDAVCRRPTWTVKHRAQKEPGYPHKKGPFPGSCSIRRVAPTSMSRMKRR